MSDYPFYPYGRAAPGEDAAPRYSSYEIDLIAARYAGDPPPYPSSSGAFDVHVGTRRPADVLYHQSIMGSHSTIGQSEALYSPNTMAKRPRLESSLPIHPQRPGEKYCAFYMRNRTCVYGEACRFDHPQWVTEGGIPNWKEASTVEESYPERPGEPDCPFFIRTSKCKFGSKCKFNHPKEKDNATVIGTGNEEPLVSDNSAFKIKPDEPCPHYPKGKCKFGKNSGHNTAADNSVSAKKLTPIAKEHNSKGLPIRPGEVDCSFYVKTGSCMYGSLCRFNHPEQLKQVLNFPLVAPLGQSLLHTPASVVPLEMLNPAANFLPSLDFHATHAPIEPEPIAYPQRPGETVCDFYMKTGFCKFMEKCKFHHPVDRSAPDRIVNLEPSQQTVTLTLSGLPRREDAEICAFYMKTGTCRFGAQCKFDHPPPGEAISKASTKQGEVKEVGKKQVVGLSFVLEN